MSDAATRSRPARRWNPAYEEVLVAALLLVAFLFFLFRLDDFVIGREGTFIGPSFWPGVLLGMGAVLSVIYLVYSVIAARRYDGGPVETAEAKQDAPAEPSSLSVDGVAPRPELIDEAPVADASADEHPTRRYVGKTVAAGVILAGYIYALAWIGFIPATILFTIAFLLLTGERRWWVLTLFPLVTSAAILLVFTQLLSVALPRGSGFFITLSTYLY